MNDNNPSSQRSDAEDDVVAMVPCEDCGHMVPERNLMIHRVRACQARARAPDTHLSVSASASEAPSSPPQSPKVVPFGVSTPDPNYKTDGNEIRQRRGAQKRSLVDLSATPQASEPQPLPTLEPDVIDLVDSPSVVPDDSSSNENHDSSLSSSCDNNDNTTSEWACPKCTLLNDISDIFCAACRHENPHRPPDAMRTEQLLPGYSNNNNNNSNSPLMIVGGGALLGGALGGIGSLMRGRSLFSGAMEGAMSGAMGGAVYSEVMNHQNQNQNHPTTTTRTNNTYNNQHQGNAHNNDDLAHARSSAVFGIPGYPSMSSPPPAAATTNGRRRAQPRSSYRVVTRNNGGSTTTIVTGGNGTSRTIVRNNNNGEIMTGTEGALGIQDPMLQLVLQSFMQQQQQQGGLGLGMHAHAHGDDDVDGMDYEQLLQAFGDGTEHLGATPSQLSQLPEHVLVNPQTELPEDAQTCYICLETFEKGETRKTLPCLHGFHQPCADKWLLTNGSCPICKHKVG